MIGAPQLSSRDMCQIWTRLNAANRRLYKAEIQQMEKLTNTTLVTHTLGPDNRIRINRNPNGWHDWDGHFH